MHPRWSSIWLLLIRAPLWQRNFPLLRQFALFIELQRANRPPDSLRGSFCWGWRAEGRDHGIRRAKGQDASAAARTNLAEGDGVRERDPWGELRDSHCSDPRPPRGGWISVKRTSDGRLEKGQTCRKTSEYARSESTRPPSLGGSVVTCNVAFCRYYRY